MGPALPCEAFEKIKLKCRIGGPFPCFRTHIIACYVDKHNICKKNSFMYFMYSSYFLFLFLVFMVEL